MLTYRRLFTPLLLLMAFTYSCELEEEKAAETVVIEKTMDETMQPGLQHIVYFWLKEGLSAEELQDFERGMNSLEASPTVKAIFVGKPAPTESRDVVDNTFDYTLQLWFDDVEGQNAYQISPVHLKFVEEHEAKFDRVRVRDNVMLD